jgi:antitoxin CptB
MDNSTQIRHKRLLFRSWHRGCKETDLILGRFADHKLAQLSGAQLDGFEKLLQEDDTDIWDWLTGKAAPSDPAYAELLDLLREQPQTND